MQKKRNVMNFSTDATIFPAQISFSTDKKKTKTAVKFSPRIKAANELEYKQPAHLFEINAERYLALRFFCAFF